MTDLQQIKAMLERAKIAYTEEVDQGHNKTTLIVERGYAGFYTRFSFDRVSGALTDIAAFE